ncbi:ATP-dependent nuclease [Bifidobacterium apri]|uniref:ATP-dependent nuclease n=1 Tax=Bifidobacterium apri TaxID=1769423 RepID=UPI00399540B2
MATEEPRVQFDIEKVVISGFKRIREPLTVYMTRQLNIIVGDNGEGKSTILEAIHLALTGLYRGEPIQRALSQALFNNGDVAEFIDNAGSGDFSRLPEIKIEVYLSGGEGHIAEYLSGAVNSEKSRHCGFTFSVIFDEDYRGELESLHKGSLKSLPIEYYVAKWMTFGDAPITPRKIPVRSVMINPAGDWQGSRADERTARVLINGLDEKYQMALAQEARIALDMLSAKDALKKANGSLPTIGIEGIGDIDITTDHGTTDSWKKNIVVRLEGVPYGHIGAGSQSMIQAGIALAKERPEKTTLLLFEEPENHLSHTNLSKLIRLIADGADGRKVIVTTHSSYVANVLGLENLQIVGSDSQQPHCSPLADLSPETLRFFRKLPGYDTLRLVLSKAAILVEGPSDELIVQLAYRQTHNNRLPIEDGIDVISVGSGFLRFLQIAKSIRKRVLVLTDNDGDTAALDKKYDDFSSVDHVHLGYVREEFEPDDPTGVDPDKKLNWNTLEAEMLRKNGLERLENILGRKGDCKASLLKYMEGNKTDTALVLFDAGENVGIPEYISEGIRWLDGKY